MKRLTPKDLNPDVYKLFDQYVHNDITRREFLRKLSGYAAMAGLTASAIFDYLAPDYAHAVQVKPDDKRLITQTIEYPSPKGAGTMKGLLTMPADSAEKAKEKLPGVIVIHENRGLNPHIEDVARRAALAGFIALAPDALTPLGGYPGNDDDGRAMQAKRDRDEMLHDFIAAFEHLKAHPKCTGKVGAVGFCFGGWVANMMAVKLPDLAAAVPFYGTQPAAEDVPKIKAPLQLHFAEHDDRVNAGWPAYEAALKEHGKEYKAYFYPGTQHGFHNDTTPRYDEGAAESAWERTTGFFNDKLS